MPRLHDVVPPSPDVVPPSPDVVPRSPDRGTRKDRRSQESKGDLRSGMWPGRETGPQPGHDVVPPSPELVSRFPEVVSRPRHAQYRRSPDIKGDLRSGIWLGRETGPQPGGLNCGDFHHRVRLAARPMQNGGDVSRRRGICLSFPVIRFARRSSVWNPGEASSSCHSFDRCGWLRCWRPLECNWKKWRKRTSLECG